ncbi:MAG TPA: hypothetical protein VNM90_17785, partial [Haliangium sp.]|nr:hypothetical protein [Haliangium sp.]
AKMILALREQHRGRLADAGRAASNLLRAHDLFFDSPIVTPKLLEQRIGVSFVTANKMVALLTNLGILEEITGNKRNRRFMYAPYLALFEDPADGEGSESMPVLRTGSTSTAGG